MRCLCIICTFCILASSIGASAENAKNDTTLPISVASNCQLEMNGKPFRAVGVNDLDVFTRLLKNSNDTRYIDDFADLSTAHIPFIRFQLLPYTPKELKLMMANPERFFSSLDLLVAEAEKRHIGLVPSVFWNFHLLPDTFGESLSAWGKRNSQTITYARKLSKALAQRYKDSSAIWIWEFSNEPNDWNDYKFAYSYYRQNNEYPRVMAGRRDDTYSSDDMLFGFKTFSNAIHSEDPRRLVEAGYDIPRNRAYHLSQKTSGIDSFHEFELIEARDNAFAQMTSFHIYPESMHEGYGQRFSDRSVDLAGFINVASEVSRRMCKPMFLGEFDSDADDRYASSDAAFEDFQSILNAFVHSNASLAAMWVFNYPGSPHNVTFNGPNKRKLESIKSVNIKLLNYELMTADKKGSP